MKKKLITIVMVIVIILTAMVPNTSYAKDVKNIKVSLRKGCTMTVTWHDAKKKTVYQKCIRARSSNTKVAMVTIKNGKAKIKAKKPGKAVVIVEIADDTYKYTVKVSNKKASRHKHRYKWVKDSTSWDEKVPKYKETSHTYCMYCDTCVDGIIGPCPNCGSFDAYNETKTEIVGYKTIHHPELGHYKCKCGKTK